MSWEVVAVLSAFSFLVGFLVREEVDKWLAKRRSRR